MKEMQLPDADLTNETDPCTPHCSLLMTASPFARRDAKDLLKMKRKTCSVEVEAGIGKRRDRAPCTDRSMSRQWDAKERVDDVSSVLL
jgi:hypothetical protein